MRFIIHILVLVSFTQDMLANDLPATLNMEKALAVEIESTKISCDDRYTMPSMYQDESRIRELIKLMMDGFDQEDFSVWYDSMTEDVVDVIGNEKVLSGLASIQDHYDELLNTLDVEIHDWTMNYFEVMGEIAICHVTYQATFSDRSTDGVSQPYPWITMWKKIEGEWKIFRDF